jgi:hypothetical protein
VSPVAPRIRFTLKQAAEFAILVDAARARAGAIGGSLVFTVHQLPTSFTLPPGRELYLHPLPRGPHGKTRT